MAMVIYPSWGTKMNFDEEKYKLLDDENRSSYLSSLGLGKMANDDFFNSEKGNDDESQLRQIKNILSGTERVIGNQNNTMPQSGENTVIPNIPTGKYDLNTSANRMYQWMNNYLGAMNKFSENQQGISDQINSKIADYQKQSEQYKDPLSIQNFMNDYLRMKQANIGAMPAIHTTAGMVATGYRPDVSGVANAVAGMIGDNQRLVQNNQQIDAQNFNNWLQQKLRESQIGAQYLNNSEKLTQLGMNGDERLAQIQAQQDYKDALLGLKRTQLEGKKPDDAITTLNNEIGSQRFKIASLLGGSPDLQKQIQQSADISHSLVSGGDPLSLLPDSLREMYEKATGQDKNKLVLRQIQSNLHGVLGSLENAPGINTKDLSSKIDSNDPSQINIAANILNGYVSNAKNWYNQIQEDKKSGISNDVLLNRIAQYPYNSNLATPATNPGVITNSINAINDLGILPEIAQPNSIKQLFKLNLSEQEKAFNKLNDMIKEQGVSISPIDFWNQFNLQSSDGKYKKDWDGAKQFLIDMKKE